MSCCDLGLDDGNKTQVFEAGDFFWGRLFFEEVVAELRWDSFYVC